MRRYLLLSLCALALSFNSCADKCAALSADVTAREEVDTYSEIVVPSMTVYNGHLFTNEAPAAPKGYKPFYITAYLRHGSRYEVSQLYADETRNYFVEADKLGLLTPLGQRVKEYMIWNQQHHVDHAGDLTQTGFNQHKGIAMRYCKAFPSLFKGKAEVVSVSSTSPRAILSMAGFNEGLKLSNPRMHNTMKASEETAAAMRPQKSAHNPAYPAAEEKAYKKFLVEGVYSYLLEWGKRQDMSHALNGMFTDPKAFFDHFADYKDSFKILTDIYKRLAFAQNFDVDNRDLVNEVFNAEERYLMYMHENCVWHYRCASAAHPILANNMAQSRVLVDYLVNRADEVISGEVGSNAHLCFGHDLNIIPLQNIFGLEGMPLYFGEGNETIEYVAEHWRGYKITPKAANIFFIFYRNKEGKVLVRPQMNERDVDMPIETDTPYYYEWEKVKELAYARLDEIDELKKGAF